MTTRPKRILFLSKDPGAVNALLPVIELMKRQNNYEPLVASHPLSRHMFKLNDIPSLPFERFGYPEEKTSCFLNIVEHCRPDVVVTGTSRPFSDEPVTPEQHTTAVARAKGITSICLLDFWGDYLERFTSDRATLANEFTPDIICALDALSRERLLAIGIPEERVAVTHNPHFDRVVHYWHTLQGSDRGAADPDQLDVLFVSQPLKENRTRNDLGYDQHSTFRHLLSGLDLVKGYPRKRVIVWLHPKEPPEAWSTAVSVSSDDVEVVFGQERGADVMRSVDVQVTAYSTMIYEALHYGTPAISIQIGLKQPDHVITNELGLTIPIYTPEDLRRVFSDLDLARWRAYSSARRAEMESDGIFFSDGRATARVRQIIEDTLT